MPTTTAGTPYTTYSDGTKLYGIADAAKDLPSRPTLLYSHGHEGPYNQFASLGSWRWLREWLIDHGWAWIESDCGGGNSWGNTAARTEQRAAVEWAMTQISVGDIIVLGRSMGGLVSYWLYLYDPVIAPKARGLIINAGTTDLAQRVRWNTVNGSQLIMNAYGVTTLAEFDVVSQGHDPMLFPTTDWAGKHVLQLYGTADVNVPPDLHAIPWLDKYGAATSGGTVVDVMQDADHGGYGPYLQVDRMSQFFAARGRGTLWRLATGGTYYRASI